MFLDYRFECKWFVVGFCFGVIFGLVGIIFVVGYVGFLVVFVIGVIIVIVCNFVIKFKFFIGVDEIFDVFVFYGIGGMVGCFFIGFFV